MKILNVCDIMNPRHGGSIERAYQINKHLIDAGYDVDLLTTSWDIDYEYLRRLDCGEKYILQIYGNKNSKRPKIIPKGLFRWIKQNIEKYDVILVSRNWSLLASFVALMAKRKRIPYIYSPMGFVGTNNKSKLIKTIYRRLFTIRDIKNANSCIAVSKEEEIDLNRIIGNSTKTVRIPNGIIQEDFDYENIEEFRTRIYNDQRKVILFIGRMEPIKGVGLLIDAYSKLKVLHEEWCLVLIGTDTDYKKKMIEKTLDLKMSKNIYFINPLFAQDKSAAYNASELVVIPSLKDAMTIIAPEAACCGKPVLYTNTCDFPELAQNGGGLEVDPTVRSMQEGLLLITKPNFNRQEMGRRGHDYVVKNLQWRNLIKEYIKLIESTTK